MEASKEQKLGVRPMEGPAGAKVPMLGPDSASGWSSWGLGCGVGGAGNQGAWTPSGQGSGPGAEADRGGVAGTQGAPRSPPAGGDAL